MGLWVVGGYPRAYESQSTPPFLARTFAACLVNARHIVVGELGDQRQTFPKQIGFDFLGHANALCRLVGRC